MYSQKSGKDGQGIEATKSTRPMRLESISTYILPYLDHMPDDLALLVMSQIFNAFSVKLGNTSAFDRF